MRSIPPASTVLAAILVVSASSIGQAADPWVEIKSPNFVVLSNAGERRARDVAWQFEQIRAALLAGWPWARPRLDRPVHVIAVKDEATMKALAPQDELRFGLSVPWFHRTIVQEHREAGTRRDTVGDGRDAGLRQPRVARERLHPLPAEGALPLLPHEGGDTNPGQGLRGPHGGRRSSRPKKWARPISTLISCWPV